MILLFPPPEFLSAGIAGMSYHAWVMLCWDSNPRVSWVLTDTLPVELHPPTPSHGLMGAHTLPMELHSHPFQQLFSLAVLFLETGCQTGCHAPYSGLLILLPPSPGIGIADVASCPSATSLLSDFCHCPCLWHGCNWMYPICTHISGLSRLCCF